MTKHNVIAKSIRYFVLFLYYAGNYYLITMEKNQFPHIQVNTISLGFCLAFKPLQSNGTQFA